MHLAHLRDVTHRQQHLAHTSESDERPKPTPRIHAGLTTRASGSDNRQDLHNTCTGVQLVTPLLLMPSPYPAARVAVDQDTWRTFRHAAIVRGISVSTYLAKLVEDELRRRKAGPIDVDAGQPPADQALAALAAVRHPSTSSTTSPGDWPARR